MKGPHPRLMHGFFPEFLPQSYCDVIRKCVTRIWFIWVRLLRSTQTANTMISVDKATWIGQFEAGVLLLYAYAGCGSSESKRRDTNHIIFIKRPTSYRRFALVPLHTAWLRFASAFNVESIKLKLPTQFMRLKYNFDTEGRRVSC
jgi:hypothetical protein